MARDLQAAMASATTNAQLEVIAFLENDFPSGISRVNSTAQAWIWNSQAWSGIPNVTGIQPIYESTDLVAQRLIYTLSGVPSEQISNAFSSIQGRSSKLWMGLISNGAIVVDPALAFDGEMESMVITEAGQSCSIALSVTNKLINLSKSRESLLTHEEQIRLFPGDLGLSFLNEIQNDRTTL